MANIHKNTHTNSVPRDTQGGWSIGQGSVAILTHVGVVHPLIKFKGYEHRGEAVESGKSGQWQTHTHTVSP